MSQKTSNANQPEGHLILNRRSMFDQNLKVEEADDWLNLRGPYSYEAYSAMLNNFNKLLGRSYFHLAGKKLLNRKRHCRSKGIRQKTFFTIQLFRDDGMSNFAR